MPRFIDIDGGTPIAAAQEACAAIGADYIGTVTAIKTAGYTAAAGETVPADATDGGFTVTLPEAPADGSRIIVKKVDDTENTVLVQRTGDDVFNRVGGPSYVQLTKPSQTVVLRYQDGVWHVIGMGIAPASLDKYYATVDSIQTLRDKTVVIPKVSSVYVDSADILNANHVIDPADGRMPWMSPAPRYQWADVLRFNRVFGAPTFEVHESGSWGSGTDNPFHWSGRGGSVQIADGTSRTGVRWTWNNGNVPVSRIRWWAIQVGVTTPSPVLNFLIEGSANGSSWTTLHSSTATVVNGAGVWLSQSAWSGGNYLRLTITTSAGVINVGNIAGLTTRLGQYGQNNESAVLWDNTGNVTIGATSERSGGVLNVGETTATTAAGGIVFGSDVTLYRSAANTLKTDDTLIVGTAGTAAGSAATIDGTQTLTGKTVAAGKFTGDGSLSQSATLASYNTADQTTNYERYRAYWSSHQFQIGCEVGGSGSIRALKFYSNVNYAITLNPTATAPSSGGTINALVNTSGAGAGQFGVNGQLSATSSTQYGLSVTPTIGQGGTAGYTAMLVNVTESATGSGAKRLIDAQVGGATKFAVSNTGALSVSGTAATISSGTGSPEGAVTAVVGSLYTDTSGGAGSTLYVKESGSGNTGWAAK